MAGTFSAQVVLSPDATQDEVAALCHGLAGAGLSIGTRVMGNFSITGAPEKFFHLFGGVAADGEGAESDVSAPDVASLAEGEMLPLAALPPQWRNIIDAVILPSPPEFGPGHP